LVNFSETTGKKYNDFFSGYQTTLTIYWQEYAFIENPVIDDKLRELFEHILQQKYKPKLN